MRRVLAALAGTALMSLPLAAEATTVEGFKLSDAVKRVHKEYGPLPPGAYDQVLVANLTNCGSHPSAALIPIETKLRRTTGSLFKFIVGWAEAETYMNIYFMDEGGNQIARADDGPPSRPKRPKEVNLGSLENGNYFLCVINSGGANAGFTVDATVSFASGYRPPPPEPDAPRAPEPTAPPEEPPAETAPPPAPASTPAPAAEPVATPGPDGPDKRQDLVAVRNQASARDGRSVAQLVFLGLTVAIGVAGLVLVALRIRRDTS